MIALLGLVYRQLSEVIAQYVPGIDLVHCIAPGHILKSRLVPSRWR